MLILGEEALVICVQAIKALTPIVRKLGPKANPANIKTPRAAVAAWAFYIGQSLALKLPTAQQVSLFSLPHGSSSGTWVALLVNDANLHGRNHTFTLLWRGSVCLQGTLVWYCSAAHCLGGLPMLWSGGHWWRPGTAASTSSMSTKS